MKGKILVVEDDLEIAMAIREYLNKKGYKVTWASTGVEGLEEFNKDKFDLVTIDIMMPEMDGFTLCKNIRMKSEVPIIILSAKDKELDKVDGLNIGADDYVTKPFSLMELHARINRHLERYGSFKEENPENSIKYIDGLRLDFENNIIYLNDQRLNLTGKEYEILNLFIKNPKKIFSKEEIYENIWGGSKLDNNTVTVHIKTLREKLNEDIRNPIFIETVWGKGYRYIGEKLL
ncbi:MAG: response regulator transcription factor [Tissierella sp.]|uniref:response regulator transcription factor n=1 Tax=Tissierella sp. TaxID=41274 RepID=UPI003F99E724